MILRKIREILENVKLDLADKICEINKVVPKKKEKEMTTIFGAECEVKREGDMITFDGSAGVEYIDNPRLQTPSDLYYKGCGCTWDTDLDGKRYHKRYNGSGRSERYSHLSYGDIINEKARIKKIIMECLEEM